MALTAAEREYLGREWRWVEFTDPAIKARHVGAREVEFSTPFVTATGAQNAMFVLRLATSLSGQLVVATVDGIMPISFVGRPPTVRLLTRRFAGDPVTGRLMLVEQGTVDHGAERTTLYLKG